MIANPQTVLALLPAAARNRLEELVRTCAARLGDKLVAVVVYGSAVRGGLTPRSNIDVLVVLRDDAPATLRLLHEPLALARVAARIECRLMVAAEIPKAADVFPVFYDDVRGCHSVLHGSDPFAGLVIHDEHRRLRVEQELRDARTALRAAVVEHAHDDASLAYVVSRLIKAVRAPLASFLRLHGVVGKDDLVTVLDIVGRRFDLDTQPLTTTTTQATAQATALAALLQRAVDDVDALEVRR